MIHSFCKCFLILPLCMALSFNLNARQSQYYSDAALDELRLELSDVKHELHSARVEINLLEEKLAKQQNALSLAKSQEGLKQNEKKTYASDLDALGKKIDRLEKILDKAMADVRNLSANDNKAIARIQELESAIALQDKKFEEIAKLKNTLTTISKAIGQSVQNAQREKAVSDPLDQTYIVKAGDSLEKIARDHNTTVDAIKKLNQLPNDKIIVRQKLKIYDEKK